VKKASPQWVLNIIAFDIKYAKGLNETRKSWDTIDRVPPTIDQIQASSLTVGI